MNLFKGKNMANAPNLNTDEYIPHEPDPLLGGSSPTSGEGGGGGAGPVRALLQTKRGATEILLLVHERREIPRRVAIELDACVQRRGLMNCQAGSRNVLRVDPQDLRSRGS